MPFGGSIYQLTLAFVIGIVLGLRNESSDGQAAALGAKASFFIGAAYLLFSDKRWWPATLSILALLSWVISGWMAARLGHWFIVRIRRLSPNK